MARLGDIIEQIRGVSYRPEDLHDALNENSVMLLRANNIRDGELNFDDVVYVDKSKVKPSQYLRAGDIFVCASSGSKELVGKAAYVPENVSAVFGAFCKVVRPKVDCPRYIGHFFDSPSYRKRISDLAAGANINNIRNEHIDELIIGIPTYEEQTEICAFLDQVNELISLRREQLAKLDELVKARFVELFGDPVSNPMGWERVPLSVCVESIDELNGETFTYMNVLVDTSKFDAAKIPASSVAYNYVCKYLLQRVSWYLEAEGKTADIVLSARGTSRDGELIQYIKEKLLPYPNNSINENVFNKVSAKSAGSWELLQLADVCATTMLLTYEVNGYGFTTPCYSAAMQAHLYRKNSKVDSYGIKFFTSEMKPDIVEVRETRICTKKERTPGATTT